MSEVKLNIVLHENQKLIHQSKARFKVVKAGKRFGKTKWALYELVQAAGRYPNEVFWYVSPSYRMSKSIAWWDLKWLIPKECIKRSVEQDLMIILWNDTRIELKGADKEDSLRGPRLKGVIFDEAAYIKEYLWNDVIRSQLIDSRGFAYFISTPKGKNWFTSLFGEAKRKCKLGDKDWESFYFTSLDNPTLNREELEKVKATVPETTWNQEFLALEQDYLGQKYSEFNFDRNVEELKVSEGVLSIRGIDWGLDHPTVCLWAKVDKQNKVVWIYDEYFKSGLTINENVKNIQDKTGSAPVEWTVIDPSANRRDPASNRSIKDEYARWGIACVDGDRRERGTDIVKMFLKHGRVKISPKCRNLIRELQILEWGDKLNDDCTDVLRYLLVRVHDYMLENLFESLITEPTKPILKSNVMSIYDLPSYKKHGNNVQEWLIESLLEEVA